MLEEYQEDADGKGQLRLGSETRPLTGIDSENTASIAQQRRAH